VISAELHRTMFSSTEAREKPSAAGSGEAAIAGLTQRMAEGAEEAFREFHAEYFARLSRYVLVLMRADDEAARDVTQETLLRVVRHVRRFETAEAFWDWLARLARSAAADHGRKTSRYQRLLAFFTREQPARAVPGPPSDELLEAALTASLAELPEAEQALLSDKYHLALSVRELAARAGCSEEAMESRLTRARRALREGLARHLRHET
jgi:RNA polymerase sigma-70 factor (ECF subfamily)